jgi:predicted nucleic acid-binding protein
VIVVDASAILAILVNAPTAPLLRAILFEEGDEIHAPHLIDIEVMHSIRRWVLTKYLPLDRAEEAIASFRLMPIERSNHQILLTRIWELRENLTAYDAAYVALAEILDAIVITTDARLARAPGMSRHIHLVT